MLARISVVKLTGSAVILSRWPWLICWSQQNRHLNYRRFLRVLADPVQTVPWITWT